MSFAILAGVACAVLFFRAAEYERMSPWAWSVASLGLTGILNARGAGLPLLLLVQVALFVVMWWYNIQRKRRTPR